VRHADVRLVSYGRRLGQSAALYAGLRSASGEICVMMDGDGQSDPADVARLVALLGDGMFVCGYRQNRQENWRRRWSSWLANGIRRLVLNDHVRDTGCTLKAMRREDVRHLLPFDGLHRYLPVFLQRAGLRIVEVPVNHRPRRHGKSKYTTMLRAWRGVHDLIGVRWLLVRMIRWPKNFKVGHE
jgi:dolichol-phosphate mannosyltransferase